MTKTVALFDLDGVLIKSGGYRAVFHAAMNYFLRIMGLDSEIGPKEQDLVIFETYGVTAEWDMLPICLAIVFEHSYILFNEKIKLFSLGQALSWVASHKEVGLFVDYEAALHKLAPYFWGTPVPAESIRLACQNGQGKKLFPHIYCHPLLDQLLSNTRSATDSLTTRILMNFQVGDSLFEQSFQMPAEVKTKSILQVYDRSLLSETNLQEIQNLFNQKRICLAYLTLRPSYPPKELELKMPGYSPEAELALEKLDLYGVPLIAYGRMQFLASQLDVTPDSLVKPFPYQALAGIKAAVERNELPALLWTGEIYRRMQSAVSATKFNISEFSESGLCDDLVIHIFEDMPVGIQSTRKAVDLLKGFGFNVKFTAWGIAYDKKIEKVLRGQGARVFSDINQAMKEFFKLIMH